MNEVQQAMFGLWELALILILALILFGPRRLPELGSAFGKGLKQFKAAAEEPPALPPGPERPDPRGGVEPPA